MNQIFIKYKKSYLRKNNILINIKIKYDYNYI